jgi:hypothetical protein
MKPVAHDEVEGSLWYALARELVCDALGARVIACYEAAGRAYAIAVGLVAGLVVLQVSAGSL